MWHLSKQQIQMAILVTIVAAAAATDVHHSRV